MLSRLENKSDKIPQMYSSKEPNKITTKLWNLDMSRVCLLLNSHSHVGMCSPVLRCRQVWCYWRIWKLFILVLSSVRFEGFYQILSAFRKWQYFICSMPLSLCKLMVLGPCNLCSNWHSDFDFNRRFGCKIFYSLCDWRCDVTTNYFFIL